MMLEHPKTRLEHPWTSTLLLRDLEVPLVRYLQRSHFFPPPVGAQAHSNPMPHFGGVFSGH